MNFDKIYQNLRAGVEYAKSLVPLATMVGGPAVGNAIAVISAISEIAQNVHDRVDDSKIVLSAQDKDRIMSIIDELALENDKLAEYIDNN